MTSPWDRINVSRRAVDVALAVLKEQEQRALATWREEFATLRTDKIAPLWAEFNRISDARIELEVAVEADRRMREKATP